MRIIQVLDALDYGDGVSNDVIAKMKVIQQLGIKTAIYSKYISDKVKEYFNDIDTLNVEKNDIILHHFSGNSLIIDKVMTCQCKKVLVYHNITPPEYFNNNYNLAEGFKQINKYKDSYNYFVGDSQFNISDLRVLGITAEIDLLPILVEFKKFESMRNHDSVNKTEILFVGRIAPNKKIEDIIDIFEYYYTNIDSKSVLKLVGNYEPYMEYYRNLLEKLNSLNCSSNVIFTGKVSEEDLKQAYKCADVFVCMSEHEGFCVPILESMYCGNITIAFNACAIKETMGNAGVLTCSKSPELIAKLIYCIMNNNILRQQIIQKEQEHAQLYSKEKITRQLRELIEKWRK